MGHSWGAFAAMNICAIHPDVTHVVAMSGFISVGAILAQNFSGPLSLFYHAIYDIEKNANPEYVRYQAQESLKGTDAKVLIIHSTDDKIVKAQNHYNILRYALTTKPNIRFLTVNHKGHNPNYTKEAVEYLADFLKTLKKMRKKGQLGSTQARSFLMSAYDWNRMSEQDMLVWERIFGLLDN